MLIEELFDDDSFAIIFRGDHWAHLLLRSGVYRGLAELA